MISSSDINHKRNKVFAYNVPGIALSKTLTVLFKLLHYVLLLDVGIYEYKTFKNKCIVKFLTIATGVSVSIVYFCLIATVLRKNAFFYWFYVLFISQYMIIVFIFTLSNGMSFTDYYKMLLRFDAKYQINSNNYYFNIKIILVIIISILNRIGMAIIYCSYYTKNCYEMSFSQIIFVLPWLTRDVILIMNVFLFYVTYCRITKFPALLENTKNVGSLRNSYKLIVDSLEKTQKPFDFVVSIIYTFI